jgi:hypothetical protein
MCIRLLLPLLGELYAAGLDERLGFFQGLSAQLLGPDLQLIRAFKCYGLNPQHSLKCQHSQPTAL